MLRDLFSLFPAHAGVILIMDSEPFVKSTFPRTCGGDPAETDRAVRAGHFSPHMRG